MKRFPTRTAVLMVLALLSFVWFFWRMSQRTPRTAAPIHATTVTDVELVVPGGDR